MNENHGEIVGLCLLVAFVASIVWLPWVWVTGFVLYWLYSGARWGWRRLTH